MSSTTPRIRVRFGTSVQSANPADWIRQAHFFLAAGTKLWSTGSDLLPALVLLGYAIELALKGYLLEKKAADLKLLRDLSHNLKGIREKAVAVGFPAHLLLFEDAENLGVLFDALPGAKGKLRAGIYPAAGSQQSVEADGDFCLAVNSLVDHCDIEICGERDHVEEARMLEQLRELNGDDAVKNARIVIRRKSVPPQDRTDASDGFG